MNSVNLLFGNNTINQSLRFSQILSQSLESVSYSLQEFATSSEFMEKMRLAFGDSFVTVTALNLAQDWQKGSITFPSLEILTATTLNGAYAGYASGTKTIYLSEEFLGENSLSVITSSILEEFGHSLDVILNNSDSSGDEGQIFAALVQGLSLPESELQALKQENDFATIYHRWSRNFN